MNMHDGTLGDVLLEAVSEVALKAPLEVTVRSYMPSRDR